MVRGTTLPSGSKLRGEMVQDSWWHKESCCSHSYSMRKTRGKPQQSKPELTGESPVLDKSNPQEQKKTDGEKLFLSLPPAAGTGR